MQAQTGKRMVQPRGIELTHVAETPEAKPGVAAATPGSVETVPFLNEAGTSPTFSIDSPEHHPEQPTSHHHHGGAPGTASNAQVCMNLVISFVGAGMLGLPYAVAQSGWLLGSIMICAVSAANYYAMMLLVQVRQVLERTGGHTNIEGYGDVGRIVMGRRGETLVNACLIISQAGFATAYLIFIAANLVKMIGMPRVLTCLLCIPGLSLLVQAREMKTLSPFSLIADGCNFFGLSAVLLADFNSILHPTTDDMDNIPYGPIQAFRLQGLLYVISISVYSLEGVGLILPLESSCQHREMFPTLLRRVLTGIALVMAFFGAMGYFAFGNAVEAPVTVGLPQDSWVASFCQLALCCALYLTYPIMMFPVHSVVEAIVDPDPKTSENHGGTHEHSRLPTQEGGTTEPQEEERISIFKRVKGFIWSKLPAPLQTWIVESIEKCRTQWNSLDLYYQKTILRICVVVVTALVAYCVPNFGVFLSLVGSSICTLLGFILPCYFHLKVCQDQLTMREKMLDGFLLACGLFVGVFGTLNSFLALLSGEAPAGH